jgi:hypothetical protein
MCEGFMGKVTDETALKAYRDVLLNWGMVTGYIQWKQLPLEWLSKNLPNVGAKLIHEAMIEHVKAGGEIDQVVERRPTWIEWKFHYDLRLPVSDRRIYIETVFEHESCLDDCTIWIVNIHDQ